MTTCSATSGSTGAGSRRSRRSSASTPRRTVAGRRNGGPTHSESRTTTSTVAREIEAVDLVTVRFERRLRLGQVRTHTYVASCSCGWHVAFWPKDDIWRSADTHAPPGAELVDATDG